MSTSNKKSTSKSTSKPRSAPTVDKLEMSRERQDTGIRDKQSEVDDLFKDRKEAFRGTYGLRSLSGIPKHRQNPQLHYVTVPQDEVGSFLDRGYIVDLHLNGNISDEMIGVANKTGSVPNFGIGVDRQVVMCIPKEWFEERNAEIQKQVTSRSDSLLGQGKYKYSDTEITGSSQEIDPEDFRHSRSN